MITFHALYLIVKVAPSVPPQIMRVRSSPFVVTVSTGLSTCGRRGSKRVVPGSHK